MSRCEVKIGKRYACDKCGKVESAKLQVTAHPTEQNKHLCEICRQDLYFENISTVARKNENRRMM